MRACRPARSLVFAVITGLMVSRTWVSDALDLTTTPSPSSSSSSSSPSSLTANASQINSTSKTSEQTPTPPPSATNTSSPIQPTSSTNSSTTTALPSSTITPPSSSQTTAKTTLNISAGETTPQSNSSQAPNQTTPTERSSTHAENVTSAMTVARPTSVKPNSTTAFFNSTSKEMGSRNGSLASSATPQPSTSAVQQTTVKMETKAQRPLSTTDHHKISKYPTDGDPPEPLSSGSVAAIIIGFILFVILIFGGAYYVKMRRPSYGRLLDDSEYGSVGNILNPMYEG